MCRSVHSFIKSLQNTNIHSSKSRQTSGCQHVADPAWRVLRLCIYSILQVKTNLQKCEVSRHPHFSCGIVLKKKKKNPRVLCKYSLNLTLDVHISQVYMASMAPTCSQSPESNRDNLVHIPLLLVHQYKVGLTCSQLSLKNTSLLIIFILFFRAQNSVGACNKCILLEQLNITPEGRN